MGVFKTKMIVWNPAVGERAEEFDVSVDTGAAFSWLSRQRLEALGVRASRRVEFRTIEGHTIERELAPVFIRVDGYIGGDNVVMAEPGDLEVMGAHTLEALAVAADPVHKKLLPIIPLALVATLRR